MISTDQDILVPWLLNKLGIAYTKGFRALGRINPATGEVLGAVGYDWWTGKACEMHIAGNGSAWGTSEFAYHAFHYPFVQCGCDVVLARVTDPKAIKFDRRIGFKTDFILEGAHPDGALHYMSMRRAECRFLERHYHGFQISRAPATA